MSSRQNNEYTDAEKLEALQILEERFNGNISQCHKHVVLKDGKQVPKRNFTEWRKKRKQLEKSVQVISDRLGVVREDGSSIDFLEANRVLLAKHDNTLIGKLSETEIMLYDKLRERLEDGTMSEAGMFKFGDMIKERLSVFYKEGTKDQGTTNNTQINFYHDTKKSMKAAGII